MKVMRLSGHYLRFNLVGLAGFALQSGVLFLLTHGALRMNYLIATVTAVEMAILNNFFWHQKWTWVDRPSSTRVGMLGRLAKFHLTNGLVSMMGNLILMGMLVGGLRLPVNGANVVSVLACGICNFLLAERVVFSGQGAT
jgi:putative flippase GtrA